MVSRYTLNYAAIQFVGTSYVIGISSTNGMGAVVADRGVVGAAVGIKCNSKYVEYIEILRLCCRDDRAGEKRPARQRNGRLLHGHDAAIHASVVEYRRG